KNSYEVLNDMPKLHRNVLARHAACKCQHLVNEVSAASGAFFDNAQPSFTVGIGTVQLEHIDRHHNGRKNVVKVVGDAAGQRADRLHTLRSEQLFLRSFLLGDVCIGNEVIVWVAFLIPDQRPSTLNDQLFASASDITGL